MTSEDNVDAVEGSADGSEATSVPTSLDPRLRMENYELLRGNMGASSMPRQGLGASVSSQLESIRASEARRLDRVRAESRRLVETSRAAGRGDDSEPTASNVDRTAVASVVGEEASEDGLDSELEALRSGAPATGATETVAELDTESIGSRESPDETFGESADRAGDSEVWDLLGTQDDAGSELDQDPDRDDENQEREDEETDMGQGTKRLAAMEQAWRLLDSFEKELFAESAGLLSSARAKQERDRVRALAMDSAAKHEERADRLGELAEEYRTKNRQLRIELGAATRRIEELQAMLVDSETGSGGEGGAVSELTGPEHSEPESAQPETGETGEAEESPAEDAPFGSLPKDFQGEQAEPEEPVRDFAAQDDLPEDFDTDEAVEEEPDFDDVPDDVMDQVPDDVPDDPLEQIPDDSGLG